jgi:ssDNA-binding Zn-finger/Zn-ribbon topoisomerase 1
LRYFAYIFVLCQMRMVLRAETCRSVQTGYFDLQLKETRRQIFVRCSSYPAAGVFIKKSRTTLPLPAAAAAESCVCPDRIWLPPGLLSNEYHVLCTFGTHPDSLYNEYQSPYRLGDHPALCIKGTKVSTDVGVTQLPVKRVPQCLPTWGRPSSLYKGYKSLYRLADHVASCITGTRISENFWGPFSFLYQGYQSVRRI